MKSGVGILLPVLAWALLAVPAFAAEENPAPVAPVGETPVAETPVTPPETEMPKREVERPTLFSGPVSVPTIGSTGLLPIHVDRVEVIFDLRFRYGAWHNADMGNALAKQYNDDFLQRARLGVWMAINENVNAMLTFHDWRRFGENTDTASTPPAVNSNFGTEVRQAWIEFVDLFKNENVAFDLKIGRQTFWTGSSRLISQNDWSQTGNLLDGISSRLAATNGSWDARFFYFRLEREDGSVPGVVQKLRHFFGVHVNMDNKVSAKTNGKINKFQPYLYILKRDEQEGTEPRGFTILTYGILAGGNLNDQFSWEAEGALQSGRLFTSYVQAFMLSFQANWILANIGDKTHHPMISFLFDWASGDNDSTDKAMHTFNPLLGESHNYLGEMDVVSRANVRAIALRALLPLRGMDNVNGGHTFQNSTLSLQLNQFWLDNSHDNWYNQANQSNIVTSSPLGTYGGVFLAARNANAPHEMGAELDIRLNTRLFNAVDASVFIGHFWPEGFPEKAGVPPTRQPNGDFDFFYAQIELFGGAN